MSPDLPNDFDDQVARFLKEETESKGEKTTKIRYDRREKLGAGGMAVVFRARDRVLNRDVALKVLPPDSSAEPADLERFRREAGVLAELDHPNIVQVFDMGGSGTELFMAMELVEGKSLADRLRKGPMDQGELVRLLEKVARGVHHAHERGVIHRDLKPANILVTPDGEPKVADFGIARLSGRHTSLTQSGVVVGTLAYMSPEQADGRKDEISPRTDVYALGAILYQILTGHPPHLGESTAEVLRKIVEEDPPPLGDVPSELEIICLKALEKIPAHRYPSASDMADDLKRYLKDKGIRARRPSALRRLVKRIRRKPVVWALSTLLILGTAGASAVIWHLADKQENPEPEPKVVRKNRSVELLEKTAGESITAIHKLREKGAPLSEYQPAYQQAYAAYVVALKDAEDDAEVEYLMGRVARAALQNVLALAFQEKALRKKPDHASARFERVVLLSLRYATLTFHARLRANIRRMYGLLREKHFSKEALFRSDGLTREDIEAVIPELITLRAELLKELNEIAESPFLKGMKAYYEGRLAESRKLIEPMLHETVYVPEHVELIARIELKAGDLPAAEQWCVKGLKHDGGSPHLMVHQAEVALRRARDMRRRNGKADYKTAVDLWTRYIAFFKDDPLGRLGRGWAYAHMAGHLWDRKGWPDYYFGFAEDDLEQLLKLDPDHTEAWWLIGSLRYDWIQFNRSRGTGIASLLKQAEASFQKACEREPDNADFRLSLAVQLLYHAEYQIKYKDLPHGPLFQRAEEECAKALQLRKDDPVARSLLDEIRRKR